MIDVSPYAKKALGQHWLTDEATLAAMCDAVDVSENDTVLEIGPGLGTLTELLVKRAKRVIAVEYDKTLAVELPDRVPAGNLDVVSQDILSFDLTQMPEGYKVVANIPYYLTSNLIRVLSESSHAPSRVALLVQKEVAERVAAGPGGMSLLSVSAQYYWEVSLGPVVKAELFTPPPKVDSQILVMHNRKEPLFKDIDAKLFFRIVKAGFAGRRKTLLNSLSAGLQVTKPETNELLRRAQIQPSLRAQNLSLDAWYRVYQVVRDVDN
jgi:16S rRNA (adenine1518-N6/adenine1519-N6)-dimethyltransferase